VVLVVALMITGLTVWGITARRDGGKRDPQAPAVVVPVLRRALDGVPMEAAEVPVAYAMVSIDNQIAARPASGIGQAPLIFEVPVEGGITRLLAVFPYDAAVAKIGPVRSARPAFIDWAAEFDATLVHVGGSPEAIDRLAKTPTRNMDEIGWGKYFWRDQSRKAPHNVYTSATLLANAERVVRGGAAPQALDAWQYKEEAALDTRPADEVVVKVAYPDPAYAVSWTYDRAANTYVRTRGAQPEKDADGRAIAAKNIVVLETKIETIDTVGRKRIAVVGEGTATVHRDGVAVLATWKKPSLTARLRFFAADGAEIAFNPGMTWIEVMGK
jgi:hypothetical protein